MNIHVKILGHRNGLTKARRSDGMEGYLKGEGGTPGKPMPVPDRLFHDRLSPKWKQMMEEFHR